MSIKNRLNKLEGEKDAAVSQWLENLSDTELETIICAQGGDDEYSEWLKTLTEDELSAVRNGGRRANLIMEKFNEYKK